MHGHLNVKFLTMCWLILQVSNILRCTYTEHTKLTKYSSSAYLRKFTDNQICACAMHTLSNG